MNIKLKIVILNHGIQPPQECLKQTLVRKASQTDTSLTDTTWPNLTTSTVSPKWYRMIWPRERSEGTMPIPPRCFEGVVLVQPPHTALKGHPPYTT